jgi:hypothetical protein
MHMSLSIILRRTQTLSHFHCRPTYSEHMRRACAQNMRL